MSTNEDRLHQTKGKSASGSSKLADDMDPLPKMSKQSQIDLLKLDIINYADILRGIVMRRLSEYDLGECLFQVSNGDSVYLLEITEELFFSSK